MNNVHFVLPNASLEQRNLIFAIADVKGMKVYPETRTNNYMADYPHIKVKIDPTFDYHKPETVVNGLRGSVNGCQIVTIDEMVRKILDLKMIEKVEFQLNKEYTAGIFNNGTVSVGCQTFPKDTIEEFIKKYKSVIDNK